MIYSTGNKYVGEWKNNILHGIGKFTWKTGEVYEG